MCMYVHTSTYVYRIFILPDSLAVYDIRLVHP